MIRLYYSW